MDLDDAGDCTSQNISNKKDEISVNNDDQNDDQISNDQIDQNIIVDATIEDMIDDDEDQDDVIPVNFIQ